jgi:hypothetical protein
VFSRYVENSDSRDRYYKEWSESTDCLIRARETYRSPPRDLAKMMMDDEMVDRIHLLCIQLGAKLS